MKAKNFISAVCALAMTATTAATFVNAAGEEVVIKGDQIEAKSGASFELNFNLAEFKGVGFSGCEFAIEFDSSKLSNVTISEGAVLKTGAAKAEIEMNAAIADEVTMVNKKDYDCFDYNTKEVDGKNVIAVLWCTGLDSDKYWAKEEGTIVTIKGKTAEGLEAGTVIPVEIKAIPREGNDTMTFGYADGNKDVAYKSAVATQGQITISEEVPDTVLWGDANDDGSVNAKDLVAMMQFMVDPEAAALTKQGILNGNMDQTDGDTDLTSAEIIGAKDFLALKKYILKDYTEDMFPIK